jgi:GTP cyclohydrolase III
MSETHRPCLRPQVPKPHRPIISGRNESFVNGPHLEGAHTDVNDRTTGSSSPSRMSSEVREVSIVVRRVISDRMVVAFCRGVDDVSRSVGESSVRDAILL